VSLFDRFFIAPRKQINQSQIELQPRSAGSGWMLAQSLNEVDRRVVLVDGQEQGSYLDGLRVV
jgi:hypothetical protein